MYSINKLSSKIKEKNKCMVRNIYSIGIDIYAIQAKITNYLMQCNYVLYYGGYNYYNIVIITL